MSGSFTSSMPNSGIEPRLLWFRLPDDEPPVVDGDLPDAGKRLDDATQRRLARERQVIANGLDAIGRPERALAVRNCCRTVYVHRYARGRAIEAPAECRDLVCPTGARARSRRLAASTTATIEKFLDQHPGLQGVMITLTGGKTVPSHRLKAHVARNIRAFGELMQRVRLKRAVVAWVRALELTRNAHSGEWHVHIHACVFVDRAAYFRRNSPLFITVPVLRKLWQKQLRLDYEPVVDIRPLRGVTSPLGDEGRKSLREVLKYCLKPGTLVATVAGRAVLVGAETAELYDAGDGEGLRPMRHVPLRAVCDALKGRRLLATSRNLQGDLDLDFTDDPAPPRNAVNLGRYLCTEVYAWRLHGRDGDYFLVARSFDEPSSRRFAMGP